MLQFVDRNQEKTLVLIPGWAYDGRIFEKLNLDYNYLIYYPQPDENFSTALKSALSQREEKKVSLLGWSQGAYLAANFALENPQSVDEVFLVSLRPQYPKDEIDSVENKLRQNTRGFLIKFYKDCFTEGEKANYQWFKQNLMQNYLNTFSCEMLSQGLATLALAQATPAKLSAIKNLTLIHGKSDKIAPAEEAQSLAQSLPRSRFISLENAGHLPFLAQDFLERLQNG